MSIFEIQSEKVIAFGAGYGGRIIIPILMRYGYDVVECFDNNSSLWGKSICDVRIDAPIYKNDVAIVICVMENVIATAVEEQCRKLGFQEFVYIDWSIIDTYYMKDFSDEEYVRRIWYARYGKDIDLLNPVTFNEKIQWMKLFLYNPQYRIMADKVAVKDYVKNKLGEEYIIPTIGVWEEFGSIDFSKMPERFVLKCSHDSGSTQIIRSKSELNIDFLKEFFDRRIKDDYYLRGREWCYKGIPRKIIAEELISEGELKDYKIHVFNGKPKLVQVDLGRFSDHKRNIYTIEWKYVDLSILYPTDPSQIEEKPKLLDRALEIASVLARNLPYVRVDLYFVGEKIYFGETTFFHGSGYEPFTPQEWEITMGNWIDLSIVKDKKVTSESD